MKKTQRMRKQNSLANKPEQQEAGISVRRSQLQVTPPLVVRTGRESDNHWNLVTNIFNSTALNAAVNHEPITKRELEDCALINAIALSWCTAAMADPAKRDALAEQFDKELTGRLILFQVGWKIEKKGITAEEASAECSAELKGITLAQARAQLAEQNRAKTTCHTDSVVAGTAQTSEGIGSLTPDRDISQSRRLTPLAMPPDTLIHRCGQVSRLLRGIDAETQPGRVSAISDRELEERARALYYVVCWCLTALDQRTRYDEIADRVLEEIRQLDSAETRRVPVHQAIREMQTSVPNYVIPTSNGTCFWWVNAGGRTQVSGPNEAQALLNSAVHRNDFLRTISDVIGEDVNTLEPDALDELLSRRHRELTRRFGSRTHLSQDELQALVRQYETANENEFGRAIDAMEQLSGYPRDELVKATRRSALIRLHIARAALEERSRGTKARPLKESNTETTAVTVAVPDDDGLADWLRAALSRPHSTKSGS